MDWLTAFSPMHIDWQQKWMAIPCQGKWTVLQGIGVDMPNKMCLQLYSTSEIPEASDLAPLVPVRIQKLVDSFAELFEPPTTLPPSRHCNHSIPLLPSAQPKFIRPYRYPPSLKDEIERQVNEMLSQGII
jgi:hypothetical protein